MIFLYVLLFAIGIYILIKSSNALVEGASSLAIKYKISPLVVGITIVAFGTSAPELVVSISSALSGSTEIAFGNVVGSSIFNILVILGVVAFIHPINIHKGVARKEIPFALVASILVFFLSARMWINGGQNLDLNGTVGVYNLALTEAMVLMSFFGLFMYYIFTVAKVNVEDTQIKEISFFKSILYIVLGLLGLSLSSKYLVTDSAVEIARSFSVSETLIGLTLVSIGTSLPELATSVSAALKKKTDIAVGNVIGSNVFNLLLILGSTLMLKDISVSGQNIADLIFLIFSTVILFVFTFAFQKYKITRIEGGLMLLFYGVYLAYLIVR